LSPRCRPARRSTSARGRPPRAPGRIPTASEKVSQPMARPIVPGAPTR
jgi:hypothetical protein